MSEQEDVYRAALRAVLRSKQNELTIYPDEMPIGPYTIMWRHTTEGGLQFKLEEGRVKQ